MSKTKGGLQKKVSSIFDGVPLDSDAARSGVRRTPEVAAEVPAVSPAPVVQPPVAKPAASVTAWPKAPSAQPGPAAPGFEPKPKSPLAAAPASETPVSAPSRPAPSRTDSPRPAQPAASKAASRVVVKRTGPANDRNRNMMLVGGLASVFVVALLWSSGIFSGGSSAPPALASSQEVAVTKPVKIEWQRPSLPLPNRNPMKLGGSVSSSQQQSATPGESSFLNVMAVYSSEDRTAALIDGRYVKVGEVCRGAKIVAITKDYVEYEINGTTAKEYVRGGSRSNQTGSTDVKPDTNTNIN